MKRFAGKLESAARVLAFSVLTSLVPIVLATCLEPPSIVVA